MFELTILFSAFTAIGSLLIFTGLPRLYHPLLGYDPFKRFSDDGFFAVIEAKDPNFILDDVQDLLASLGGTNIAEVYDE
jgi:hypothetical protein